MYHWHYDVTLSSIHSPLDKFQKKITSFTPYFPLLYKILSWEIIMNGWLLNSLLQKVSVWEYTPQLYIVCVQLGHNAIPQPSNSCDLLTVYAVTLCGKSDFSPLSLLLLPWTILYCSGIIHIEAKLFLAISKEQNKGNKGSSFCTSRAQWSSYNSENKMNVISSIWRTSSVPAE